MYKRLTASNIILFIGFFLSETCLFQHFIQISDLNYSPWNQDAFFAACTLVQIFAFFQYIAYKPLKHYTHIYEFILLPLFSINFLKSGNFNDYMVMNSVRISIFILGWTTSLIMVLAEYARYNEEQTQSLMKISNNLRVVRLAERLLFVLLLGLSIIKQRRVVFIFMLSMSAIQFYVFLTTFTFQNPFHEYLVMVSVLTSIASWLDFTFYIENFSRYSYVGQIFFIIVCLFEPQIFKKALQLKYQIYGEKNIQTRQINQLLGVFVVMKEIIFNQHHSFKYTTDFDNKMHVILQKMMIKNKIQPPTIQEQNVLEKKGFLNEDQILFLKILEKRLKQSNNFIAYEFYIMTIVRKGLNFENKALTTYYQKQSQKSRTSTNVFTRIQMNLLYTNLIKRIQTKRKHEKHHAVLIFCNALHQLRLKIVQLCKHEVGLVNLFQNSFNVPVQKYSGDLIERYELKSEIRAKIDELNNNHWHIHSGNFLYLCLLYKVIFQRQQKIIEQKIHKNFIIPLALESKKNKVKLSQNKNTSILVFSVQQKGQIINQNQLFLKLYGKCVRSGQKSKKYISDLFPSLKQKINHQELMEASTKYEELKIKDHSSYDCLISRKIMIKENCINDDDSQITIMQHVKISTRIYYEMFNCEAFICIIEPNDTDIGIKVMKSQIQTLRRNDMEFQVLKQHTITQLNQQFEAFQIILRDNQDSFAESRSSDQVTELNISQNLIFTLDVELFQYKKVLKIQKEYDKEEVAFNMRRMMIVVALAFPILSLLINVICLSVQLNQITRQSQILESEKIVFEKTLLNQKFVGFNLILYRLVTQGYLNSSMCTKYKVQDLKQFTIDNLQSFATQNFDQMQSSFISVTKNNQDLKDVFIKPYYKFFDLQNTDVSLTYFKYTSLMKSIIFEYTSTRQTPNWNNDLIKSAINTSQLLMSGLYNNLRLKYAQSYKNLIGTIDSSLVAIMVSNSIIFVLIALVFHRLINYKYSHIMLLKDFRRQFVQARVRQMDFIINQISKLERNQIFDVQINKKMNIIMTKNNQQKIMDLNQFEKQSFLKIPKNGGDSSKSISVISSVQLEEQKEHLLDNGDLSEQRRQKSTLLIMVQAHKYKLLVLLLFFVTSGVLNVVHSGVLKQKANQHMKMQDTFNQMGTLISAMNDLLIGQVIKFSGRSEFSNQTQNNFRISNAITQIESNPFQQKVYDLFEKDIYDFVLYSSYCGDQTNLNLCQSIKSGVLSNGLSSIVSFLPVDYNMAWNNKLSENISEIKRNQVCEKVVTFINYTNKVFQPNLVVGYNSIQEELNTEENQMELAEAIVSILMIFTIGITAQVIIQRGIKVRREVLSMDMKQNLYQLQQKYRPYLNQLYYREEPDEIQ